MDRTDVLSKCYVSPLRYANHIRRSTMCTKSNKYSLVYFMLPKSGSSTGRHVMKHSFDSKEFSTGQCRNPDTINYGKFSPVVSESGDSLNKSKGPRGEALKSVSMRNPLSRFYASYDEMFVRRLGHPSRIPSEYRAFMMPYEGWEYSQYSALFDQKPGVKRLTDTFETFVEAYDGVDPFDEHLTLQSPLLGTDILDVTQFLCLNIATYLIVADRTGKMRKIDLVFDTHDMDKALHRIAEIGMRQLGFALALALLTQLDSSCSAAASYPWTGISQVSSSSLHNQGWP